MKRDGEQVSKVDIVHCQGEEGKKDGRQGGREVESEGGDERRWMERTQRLMERGTDGGRQGMGKEWW